MRLLLLLFIALVGCNKTTTTQAPTQAKAVSRPLFPRTAEERDPKDDWFVVNWKASPNGDRFGAAATLRHHNNIYKVRCSKLNITYHLPPDPAPFEYSGRLPCSILAQYVGESIAQSGLVAPVPRSDGREIDFDPPKDGFLTFNKKPSSSGSNQTERFMEMYSIVSVESTKDIGDKDER